MLRTTLIDLDLVRTHPAPTRGLLYGTTYGISAYTAGRLERVDGLSEKGYTRAGVLQDSQVIRPHPAPARSLLYGTTYGISAYTEGRLIKTIGIQEIPTRRRSAVLTCFPGRIPS